MKFRILERDKIRFYLCARDKIQRQKPQNQTNQYIK